MKMWQSNANALISLAKPCYGERILDFGCGNGVLTKQVFDVVHSSSAFKQINDSIKETTKRSVMIGIDINPNLISMAKINYPEIQFEHCDIQSFHGTDFDLVFSNAVFHWIPEADIDTTITCISQLLKPSGRLVTEFAGKGQVERIVLAFRRAAELFQQECSDEAKANFVIPSLPWYYPTISDFAQRLERNGCLEVVFAEILDQPTVVHDGVEITEKFRKWIQAFGHGKLIPLTIVSEHDRTRFFSFVENELRSLIYDSGKQQWIADYRRIRFIAKKK